MIDLEKIQDGELRTEVEIYRRLVDAMSEGVAGVSVDGKLRFANRALAEMLGASKEALAGRSLGEWLVRFERASLEELLRRGAYEECRAELTLRTSSGGTIPVQVVARPLDSSGTGVCVLFTDLSEQRRKEQLLASESLAQSILSQAQEAIVVFDAKGCVIRASHAAVRLAGSDPLGRPFHDAFPLLLADGSPFPLSSVLQGEILQGFEVSFSRGEEPYSLHLTAGPLVGEDARLVGGVITLIDITPRKHFEEKLRQQSEALGRSNADLQQFAYVASHDLQEPLRMVRKFVTLLQQRYQGRLDADADEYIQFAAEGALRMYTLINDLLAFSRLDQSGEELTLVSSERLLGEALGQLKIHIEQNGAQITSATLPEVVADAGRLRQVFQHLIENAIKFRGSLPPKIHIEALPKGKQWLFLVKDNGIGIEEQYSDRIFTIFQRLHTRTEYPGNGIGLAMCKRIVERHGGRIWVVSQPGQGATFYFTLPVREPPEEKPTLRPDEILSPLTPRPELNL